MSLWFKLYKHSILATLILIFLWYSIAPVVFQETPEVRDVDMYYINSNYYINNVESVIADIKKYNPKYVAVVELRDDLKEALEDVYGAENSISYDDGVLSYWVFSRTEIPSYTKHIGNIYPFLEFEVEEGSFYLIHPLPPTSLFWAGFQQENFWEVMDIFNTNIKKNKFILGDFNSSHYSRVFQKYFWHLNYDVYYSWKKWHPLSIPIDYILWATDNFQVALGDLRASDHSPLLIQFD